MWFGASELFGLHRSPESKVVRPYPWFSTAGSQLQGYFGPTFERPPLKKAPLDCPRERGAHSIKSSRVAVQVCSRLSRGILGMYYVSLKVRTCDLENQGVDFTVDIFHFAALRSRVASLCTTGLGVGPATYRRWAYLLPDRHTYETGTGSRIASRWTCGRAIPLLPLLPLLLLLSLRAQWCSVLAGLSWGILMNGVGAWRMSWDKH